MITLEIEDFSCIKKAKFELAPVTILIGPQGSGKSVTTKILYFCIDILSLQHDWALNQMSMEEVKKDIAKRFALWFPPSAWGLNKSKIYFQAGEYTVRFMRRLRSGNPSDDMSVAFSRFFTEQYKELCDAYKKISDRDVENNALLRRPEATWKVQAEYEKKLNTILGNNFFENQTFIPAGRAFFTSIGRIVAAIEQGSTLDPVTIRFAKLFANLRDFASRGIFLRRIGSEDVRNNKSFTEKLFNGHIKFEKDSEYIETLDGRRIPFSALSSGQQELFPMWLLLDYYSNQRDSSMGDLFYIEEPEAHLFPDAQSTFMDFLIGRLVSKKEKRSLIVTTHSPYILSKLNNFLKAGKIGKIRKNSSLVAEVVSRDCWLTEDRVRAYAIQDGMLINILDDDGIINGNYIDSVSEEVSNTFEKLLDIEYPGT